MRTLFPSMIAVLFLAAPAFGQTAPAEIAQTSKGQALVNAAGMTLYVSDRDTGGKSACNGPCTAVWPPLMATADAKATGGWTTMIRNDGQQQWAYNGRRLYAHSADKKPGDVTGDGVNKVWHIAAP